MLFFLTPKVRFWIYELEINCFPTAPHEVGFWIHEIMKLILNVFPPHPQLGFWIYELKIKCFSTSSPEAWFYIWTWNLMFSNLTPWSGILNNCTQIKCFPNSTLLWDFEYMNLKLNVILPHLLRLDFEYMNMKSNVSHPNPDVGIWIYELGWDFEFMKLWSWY